MPVTYTNAQPELKIIIQIYMRKIISAKTAMF